ncbi:Tautomerase/MIF [Phellopilus nigrolimitatus]|nr:Tautomerase/MIF [Phellopilus nigrolimitatus]
MPIFQLTTNVKIDEAKTNDIILELSKLGAQLSGLPEFIVSVDYTYSENLSFAGTFEPAFFLNYTSGHFTPEKNIEESRSLFKFLGEKLGVNSKRGFIQFQSPGADYIGFAETTVTEFKRSLQADKASA